MKKLILILLIFSLLPLTMAAGDNWKLYFSDGITTINGTDICVSTGQCLSDGANASGDITAVNTDGNYLTGGALTGAVSLLVNETYLNATIDSRAGSGNSSWNETYADTLYIEVGEEGNLNVNSSDYWDDMDTINATQMEDNDGTLNILITWLSTAIDNWLSGKDTDDLTEGSTNLYDNSTWNETYADTLYAATGAGNSSFNQSLTDELYVNITGDSMTGNLTNSEWFNGQFNWTTTDEWSSFDGTTFDFNESNLETIYFIADAIQVITGTGSGDLADIQTYNQTTYNVTEDSSDFELRVNFTGITEFTTLIVRHKVSEVADHTTAIQIWDYGDSAWEGYGFLSEELTSEIQTFGVYDDAEHIDGGVVQVRVYQDELPGSSHIHQFDWVGISKGFGTPVGTEVDPLSFHKNENLNNSEYNISADYFFGNISQAVGLSGTDNSSWNESYADTLYAAAGAGNASWNETHANTLYIEVGEEGNLNTNSSDYWDDMGTINATQMEDNGGTLNILITWLSTAIDNWLSGKDTDDLTEGSTNLYDNSSWNETYADAQYAASGAGNASWNETHADTLYADISIDGDITAVNTNGDYLTGGTEDGDVNLEINETTFNSSAGLIADYWIRLNPYNFYNATNQPPGSNSSWNETHADTLYADISLTDTNASTVCATTEVLLGNGTCFDSDNFYDGSGDNESWNETHADSLYYGIANPYEFWNSTNYNGNISLEYGDIRNQINSDGEHALRLVGTNTSLDLQTASSGFINFLNSTGGNVGYFSADEPTIVLPTIMPLSNNLYDIGDSGTAFRNITALNFLGGWNGSSLYYLLSNPFGFYNSTDFSISDYSTTATLLSYSWYNSTDFDIADYSLTSALVGLLGNWSADKGDYSTTAEAGALYATIDEPLWAANYTAYNETWNADEDTNLSEDDVEGYIFDDDNTDNFNMSVYNITNSGSGLISSNSTCILIYGNTSVLEIC